MAEERAQRRLAAILAADAVGYSRLMGTDEAGTLARLKTIHADLFSRNIAEHRGRIVKEMGDGLLVVFASVVDAVQCAMEIQRGLHERNAVESEDRRIEFRMGVNVGDVIAESDDIYGDAVNIAARLEALAQPGDVVVSEDAYRQVRRKVDLAFEDLGGQELKNIAEPVRAFRMKAAAPTAAAASAAAVLTRPALAVLPFVNMSGDTEQEYFVDGLTEDIITTLSYWRSFPVIARNSTFAYKGRSVDVRTVATELGARYVLEGSVRKGGERVRVTAQLIDAMTGHHVWAERFDRKLEDMFELQDELTERIAATVAPELERAERRRVASHSPSLNAWDLYQRGMSFFYEVTREGSTKAHEMFERAISIDQKYSQAHASLARIYHDEVAVWQDDRKNELLAKSLAAARRAVQLDDTDSYAHTMLGNTYMRMA